MPVYRLSYPYLVPPPNAYNELIYGFTGKRIGRLGH